MDPYKFPKLPDQDDYLLNLQNTNYSMRTVINYARDLCIFAMFLRNQSMKFEDLDKRSITIYKGYLRNGDHIRDLNNFREEIALNSGILSDKDANITVGTAKDGASSSKGSKNDDTNPSGMNTPPDISENAGTAPKTTESYLDDVYRKVYGSLGSLKTGRVPKSSNPNAGAGLDSRSVNRMLSALRSYLKYRISFDLDVPIPPDAIQLLKSEKREKKVAQFDELVTLIESPTFFEKDERVALRNRAMMEILFSTGMRISELISMDLTQVNLDGKFYILGKGKKERYVYLTPRAMKWLDAYLGVRLKYIGSHEEAEDKSKIGGLNISGNVSFGIEKGLGEDGDGSNDSDANEGASRETSGEGALNVSQDDSFTIDKDGNYSFKEGYFKNIDQLINFQKTGYLSKFHSPALFIPFSGGRNKRMGTRISTNHFQEKIADYRRRIGIQVPTSAHSLRHGFATYLAENGASAAAIQILLGHESLNTTTKYLHASDKFAEGQHRKMHPLG